MDQVKTGRLAGIKIYGFYACVVGMLNGVGNLALSVFVFKMSENRPANPWLLLLWSLMGWVLFVAGVAVFRLKPLGRTLAIACAVFALLLSVTNLFQVPAGSAADRIGFVGGYIVFPVLLNGWILKYFLKQDVRDLFQ